MKVSDSGGGDFQRPDPGTYLARCVRIIDLGTQAGEYQGKPTSKRQVVIGWELPTELIPTGDYAGEPFLVTRFYTASLGEKANLRHDLVNWRTKEFTEEELASFDLVNILGKPCLITLSPNDKGNVRVTGVTGLPRGTTVPDQVNPSVNFDLEDFDANVYSGLSEWFRETIAKSPEYAAAVDGKPPVDQSDFRDVDFGGDDIPF